MALALGGGTCLAVYAFYVWRRRRATAAASLAVVLAAAGWWGLAYAIELAASRLSTRLLWGDAKWLGICLLPPAWFAFVMQYTGRARWVNRSTMAALAIPPAAVIVLLANQATHDLVRYYPPSAATDPTDAIAQVGPLFWPFLAYADLVVWGCTALFVWTLTRLSRLYWRESLLLIVTVLLPFLANVLHNLNVGPFGRVELTPFLFVLTGTVLVWGIFRFRMLDLAPMARGRIFQIMHDAVVVLDPYARVVDANLAAERLIGQPVGRAVGQPLEQLVPGWAIAISRRRNASTSSDNSCGEAIIAGRAYELTVSALRDRQGQPAGELLIARDIGDRRQAEQDLLNSLAREQAATERLTVALRQEQAATERLRALDEMKDAFLQTVSHDLRTPLTSVLGIAVTLHRGHQLLPVSEVRDLLGRLEGNARKLDRLLTNLLDLERLAEAPSTPTADASILVSWSAGSSKMRRRSCSASVPSAWRPRPCWSRSTRPRSSGSWRTCLPTRLGTPGRTRRSGCESRRVTGARSSSSRTPDPACRPRSVRRSSSRSGRDRASRPTHPGPASAWRWWPTLRPCTAARPGYRSDLRAVPRFECSCPTSTTRRPRPCSSSPATERRPYVPGGPPRVMIDARERTGPQVRSCDGTAATEGGDGEPPHGSPGQCGSRHDGNERAHPRRLRPGGDRGPAGQPGRGPY